MDQFDLVVATQDWHLRTHTSFASQHQKNVGEVVDLNGLSQILWPDHCVQGSKGADFVQGLRVDRIDRVFQKGMDENIDSYSGFFDNGHKKNTGLGDYLKRKKTTEVYVVGLAADYCVKYTALDAVALNFPTCLIKDACRGVDLHPGDVEQAIKDMAARGVRIITTKDLASRI